MGVVLPMIMTWWRRGPITTHDGNELWLSLSKSSPPHNSRTAANAESSGFGIFFSLQPGIARLADGYGSRCFGLADEERMRLLHLYTEKKTERGWSRWIISGWIPISTGVVASTEEIMAGRGTSWQDGPRRQWFTGVQQARAVRLTNGPHMSSTKSYEARRCWGARDRQLGCGADHSAPQVGVSRWLGWHGWAGWS
jgi:hypothetical protein